MGIVGQDEDILVRNVRRNGKICCHDDENDHRESGRTGHMRKIKKRGMGILDRAGKTRRNSDRIGSHAGSQGGGKRQDEKMRGNQAVWEHVQRARQDGN